jgi:hypothetical protein
MKIRRLKLKDYRGYYEADFSFEDDFSCLFGPNGIGKTSVLEAVSLACSSLDFGEIEFEAVEPPAPFGGGDDDDDVVMSPMSAAIVTPAMRRMTYLRKNIRDIDEEDAATGFRIEATVEHDGKEHQIILNEKGFEENIVSEEWWWAGLTYMAQFDADMRKFSLPMELWDKFASRWEQITGYGIEPDVYVVDSQGSENAMDVNEEEGKEYAVGFWIIKPNRRVYSRKASAGENKIAKVLGQITSLPAERMPHVILLDNVVMHVHYKRHLDSIEAIKGIFDGIQIIATTHSPILIEQYEPRSQLIDVEDIFEGACP